MIAMERLQKSYQQGDTFTFALRDVSLEIAQGEFVSIMGPSGSGKSTLMHILGLLDTPTSGQYSLLGTPVTDYTDEALARLRNEKIGFVFQSFHLLPRLTALENVELPLIYSQRMPRQERQKKAKYYLEKMGLLEHIKKYPSQLSGGQKQRVAIARSLVAEPLLLLADEPTGALDSKTSHEIMEVFRSLHQEGQTIVLITHDPQIAQYASRTLIVRDGAVLERGE